MSLFAKHCPDAFDRFSDFGREAMKSGALTLKTKELIAAALSVASHCEPCLRHHLHAARKAGATKPEVAELIGVCVLMLGGPANVWTQKAVGEVFGDRSGSNESGEERCS